MKNCAHSAAARNWFVPPRRLSNLVRVYTCWAGWLIKFGKDGLPCNQTSSELGLWLINLAGWVRMKIKIVWGVVLFNRSYRMHLQRLRDLSLGRPTYSRHIGLIGFNSVIIIFYLRFFVSYPRSSPNGTQPKLATCSDVNLQISKCISKIWVEFSPKTIEPRNYLGLLSTFFDDSQTSRQI